MPSARYFIVQVHDAWAIRYGDEEFGPYTSRDEAMIFAIDAAKKLGERGESVQVCLMGDNGHFRPEWSSGQNAQSNRL